MTVNGMISGARRDAGGDRRDALRLDLPRRRRRTGARYLLSGWVLATLGAVFPWGTLAVNVLGSFLLGAIMHVGLATPLLSPPRG
jgi:hypothetical protein